MLAGQVIAGASLSFMATVKVQLLVFPAASVATQVTVLVPLVKVEPVGGVQATVAPAQLSLTVVVKVTLLLEQWPRSVLATMLVEQVIDGFCTSFTVTVNVQLAVPQVFEAVAVTEVVPTGKVIPEFGE